jgi:hypothetical protein
MALSNLVGVLKTPQNLQILSEFSDGYVTLLNRTGLTDEEVESIASKALEDLFNEIRALRVRSSIAEIELDSVADGEYTRYSDEDLAKLETELYASLRDLSPLDIRSFYTREYLLKYSPQLRMFISTVLCNFFAEIKQEPLDEWKAFISKAGLV